MELEKIKKEREGIVSELRRWLNLDTRTKTEKERDEKVTELKAQDDLLAREIEEGERDLWRQKLAAKATEGQAILDEIGGHEEEIRVLQDRFRTLVNEAIASVPMRKVFTSKTFVLMERDLKYPKQVIPVFDLSDTGKVGMVSKVEVEMAVEHQTEHVRADPKSIKVMEALGFRVPKGWQLPLLNEENSDWHLEPICEIPDIFNNVGFDFKRKTV